MSGRAAVVWLCALMSLGACEKAPAPPSPPFTMVVGNKQLMAEVIEPAADTYWDAVGSTSDKNGITEHAPRTDEEWTAVRNSATTVAEAGNLLMMSPRALNQGEWMTLARGMVEAGVKAREAAQAHDVQKVFDAGADLYESCVKCHSVYVVAPSGPAASSPAVAGPAAASPASGKPK